jgi:hypothetical protein
MKTIEAFGHLQDGVIKAYNDDVFKQQLQEVGSCNHIRIIIEYGNKRTVDQNAYLWGAFVSPLHVRLRQDGWEFTPGQVYKFLENKFCKETMFNDETGEVFECVKPLKELSTEEFQEIVVGKIRDYTMDKLGIEIKLPHEYYQMPLEIYEAWKKGEINKSTAMDMAEKLQSFA